MMSEIEQNIDLNNGDVPVNAEIVNQSAETQTEPEETENKTSEEDIISLTRDELNARELGIKRIAERKARKQFEADLAQQYATQPQKAATETADSVWDANLNTYIPKNITIADYQNLINQASQPQNGGYARTIQDPQYQQPTQPVSQITPDSKVDLSDKALFQVAALTAKDPNVSQALQGLPISIEMANAVAIDPDGITNLYEAIKSQPHEIFKICQLSPIEQQAKMWELNQKCRLNKASKIKTNATPQPAPLSESGFVNKKVADMTYAERKAIADQAMRNSWQSR